MKMPPVLNTSFEEFLQALPEDYHEQAYEFKAFTRGRKIRSPLELLELVLLYCGLDLSLRSCAGEVAQRQGYLTDQAVLKRLKGCVPWVKSLLSGVFGLDKVVNSGELRFIVIDGSTAQEPGATQTTYRLHLAIDLINLTLYQSKITTDKEGENLDHYQLGPGDIVMLDQGYNEPKSLVPFLERGGEIVLRYNAQGMKLYEEESYTGQLQKVQDWVPRLKTLNQTPHAFPVWLVNGDQEEPVYLHTIPLPEEQAAAARRKAKKVARKKGRTPRAATLYLKGWVLVLCSLSPKMLDTETVSQLYRCRWQVELVIKRLKSLLNFGRLKAKKGSKLAELYLYGKLLFAAVIEKIGQKWLPSARRKMNSSRQVSDWRLWQLVIHEVKAGIQQRFPFLPRYVADVLKSLAERPRKRQLQKLPDRILQWVADRKLPEPNPSIINGLGA